MAKGRASPPARTAAAQLEQAARLELVRLLPSGRSLLIGFATLGVAAVAYALARTTPLFAVRTIEVRGVTPALRAEVRRVLDRDRGTSLVGLRGDALMQRVSELPEVVSARYDRHFPHTLRIFVQPERPVAVLRRGRDSWLVSARGRVIRPLPPRSWPRLPRVWLSRGSTVRVGGLVADRGRVAVRAVASIVSPRLAQNVRGAVLTERLGLLFVLRSGVQVRFGTTAELPLKLEVVARIAPLLPRRTVVLDVSVPERPVSWEDPLVEG